MIRFAFAALLSFLPALAFSADPPTCKLVRVAEWPVRFVGNLPVIDGTINGKKVGILLDTGAYASLVTTDAARRLDLPMSLTGTYASGVGGDSRIYVTRLDEIRIGEAVRNNMRVRVTGERPIRGVDFILGDDLFKKIDLEFDYAKGVVRLFDPQDCGNAALGYWDPGALQVPMENESKIVLPVRINGVEGRALLDSGASSSVISLPLAAKAGITPQSAGVSPAGCSAGIGSDLVHAWVAPFETVQVGDELIRNPSLRIEDFTSDGAFGRPEALLGSDFLRSHRVYVSRYQKKIYFTYAGGLVFPATPWLACEEGDRDSRALLAQYEEALAKNPADTKALLGRSLIRSREKDLEGALADLDSVIRMQPNNAVALYGRAGIRASQKQYEAALADMDGAIANGMRNGQTYMLRASIRRAQGDYERALSEYDQVLKVEPTHREALRTRAWLNFLTGKYEAADRDYTALMEVQPRPLDAAWLHMTRARREADAKPLLEQELAKLKDGAWPAPILAFELGRIDRDALIAAAAGSGEKERRGRECAARYYVADRLLLEGSKPDAQALLEKAVTDCPRNQGEYEAAVITLGTLR